MRPRRVVVGDVLEQDPAEVALAQWDDVVGAVAAQRPDQALCDPVRLRRPNRRQHGLDADRARLRDEVTAVGAVAVSNEEARAAAPRCCFNHLAPHTRRVGVRRHVDVLDAATVVRDEEQHIEGLEQHGPTVKKSAAQNLVAVIGKERLPALRRWAAPRLEPVAAHRLGAHLVAQRAQLTLDSARTPTAVLLRHLGNQLACLRWDPRASCLPASTLPAPVATPPSAVPVTCPPRTGPDTELENLCRSG